MRVLFFEPDEQDEYSLDMTEDDLEAEPKRPKPQPPERLPVGSPAWLAEARRGAFELEARQERERRRNELLDRLEDAENDTDFSPDKSGWVDLEVPRKEWAERTWAKRFDPDRPSDRDLAVASVRLEVSVDELEEVVGPGKYPRNDLKALRFHNSHWVNPNDGDRASREGTAGGVASGQARRLKSNEQQEQIRRLHQNGFNHKEISEALKVSIRTIQRAFKNQDAT